MRKRSSVKTTAPVRSCSCWAYVLFPAHGSPEIKWAVDIPIGNECYTTDGFARASSQSTGVSPHRWLVQHRIQCAKDLLRGDALLADSALRCGFADQSHFTRCFGREVGVSPGQWRRGH